MKKHTSKLIALVLALCLCLSLSVSAFAAEIDSSGGSGSGSSGSGSSSGSKPSQPTTPGQEESTTDFADVKKDTYYFDAVAWAVKNQITSGTSATEFTPDATCTRAQIVTFLWRAAGCPEPKTGSSFSDVPVGSYYAKAVAWAVERGITTGTGDGRFSPDAGCTRAQAVTFLYRALGKQTDSSAKFSDVPAGSYYADAVNWAVENNVTNGTGAATFSPNADCTRAQIVTFLYRAAK